MSTTAAFEDLQKLKKEHEHYLSVCKSAELLNVTPKTIRRRCRLGELDGVKIMGKWRIAPQSIRRHLTGSQSRAQRYRSASAREKRKGPLTISTVRVPEAAECLGVSRRTVRNMCMRGDLDARKVGRSWRIDRESLLDVMQYGTEDLI